VVEETKEVVVESKVPEAIVTEEKP